MGFGAASDRFTDVAWVVAVAALALSVAVAVYVLAMRRRTAARERARERFVAAWRPLLFDHLVGGAPVLPAVSPRDEESFLLLWIQLQDGLRGEARARFNPLAEAVGARRMIRRRLDGKDVVGRLLALRTLGYLGDPADYGEVLRHLDEPRSYLCLAAARALVHIDPRRAPDDILPRLAERVDWPIPLFSTVLAEADPAPLSAWFRAIVPQLPVERLVRLLPLVSTLGAGSAEDIVRDLLAADRDPEVLCAALKHVSGPALTPLVRRTCEHGAWAVRTQAAAALGRIGALPERDLLVRLLGDREWWVRYRAAQALCSGRFGAAEEIKPLVEQLHDRFAHDIVEHALAEGRR